MEQGLEARGTPTLIRIFKQDINEWLTCPIVKQLPVLIQNDICLYRMGERGWDEAADGEHDSKYEASGRG